MLLSDIKDTPASPEIGLWGQLAIARSAFWACATRNRILSLAAALLTIILVIAYGQIVLNRWNVPFYNSLERRDSAEFIHQLGIFGLIAGTLLILNVIQTWLNQITALYMREGLSRDLVDHWLTAQRALRLSASSPLGINPDQRLHEDARKLAEMTTSLSIGLVQSSILLISFVGVLWQLSSGFVFHVADRSFSIPGYMVWAAFIYAAAAAIMSNAVGGKLPGLNAERYSREAELRFSLMQANENLEAITLAGGEQNVRRHIHGDIDAVLKVIRSLAIALTNLTWVSAGFGWLAVIVPILVASPAYFAGTMTFGGLMMAAAAFTQVYAALRWYVDNFGAIADWRATLQRVTVFRVALSDMDIADPGAQQIAITSGTPDEMILRDLIIDGQGVNGASGGGFRLKETDTVITQGERIMINGDQGVNRKMLLHAMAGLWRAGSGSIVLPAVDDIIFMPQTGYLPEATLRDVISYPLSASTFSEPQMSEALAQTGLQRLQPMFDQKARWERLLDKDDQIALAFANLLLRRPRWIVFNDVLEGLETDNATRLASVLKHLEGSTLIYIGRSQIYLDTLSPRLLHLERYDAAT
ncbi:MAG: ABC transporter ATP-binding protein/permease [Allorhizobium sp.]